ncbi:MAG TPA: HEPN domain-containing protein [Candidatus Nanoarchaeia archaeon]|nr:HEPN domain-containing protein [Candidatus Nanoarchaeia archaeon]
MQEEVRKWIGQAERDLITAKNSFKSNDYYASAYWAQQVVEKALKALLIKSSGQFPKVHDLTRLAKLINAPNKIIELCAKLNPSYTDSRYPNSFKPYNKSESKESLKYAEEVLKWIKENLK